MSEWQGWVERTDAAGCMRQVGLRLAEGGCGLVELPDHPEITTLAAHVVRGELSELERAHLATLMILLGAGMRTHAAVGAQHPGDQARQDEFAGCVWALATELLVAMMAQVRP